MAAKNVAGKSKAPAAKKKAPAKPAADPKAKAAPKKKAPAKPAAEPKARAAAPKAAKAGAAPKAKAPSAAAAKPAKKVASKAPKPPARPPRRAKPTAAQARELAALKERLLAEHRELMNAYVTAKGDTRERQAEGTEDYIDYAVNSYDREFMLSLTETQQRQLLLIEDALRRIDRGDYGRCMQCDKEIPPKRLEVQPWAQFCVACQELADQGLLQPRSLDELSDEDFEDLDEEMDEVEEEVEIDDSLEGDESAAAGAGDSDDDEESIGL
jgi:DnaK suppressor protein